MLESGNRYRKFESKSLKTINPNTFFVVKSFTVRYTVSYSTSNDLNNQIDFCE